MRRHRDQAALLLLGDSEDLCRRCPRVALTSVFTPSPRNLPAIFHEHAFGAVQRRSLDLVLVYSSHPGGRRGRPGFGDDWPIDPRPKPLRRIGEFLRGRVVDGVGIDYTMQQQGNVRTLGKLGTHYGRIPSATSVASIGTRMGGRATRRGWPLQRCLSRAWLHLP